MHSLVVPVSEVAFAHQVNNSHMIIRECHQLIAEKYGIWVVVQVEVIDGKVIESLKALIAQYRSWECVQFWEEVLRVVSVIGLEQLR